MLKKHGGGNNNKARRISSDDESGGGPSREMFKQSSQASPLFRKSASIDPPESLSDNERPRPPSQQSARGEGKKKILSSFLSNLFGNKTPEDELNNGSNINGKKSTSRESVNSVLSSSSFSYVNPKKMGGKQMKGKRIPVDDPNYDKIGDGRKTLGATLDRIGMKMGLKKKYNLQSCESLQYIDACEDAPPLPLLEVLTGSSPPKSTPVPKSNNTQGMLASDDQLGQCEIVPTTVTELSAECQAITDHFSSKPSDKASTDCPDAYKVVKKVVKTTAILSQNVPQKNEASKLPSSKTEDIPSNIVASIDSSASPSQDLPKKEEVIQSPPPTLQEPPHKIGTKLTSSTQVDSKKSVTQTTSSTENASPKILLKTAFLTGTTPQKIATTPEVTPQKIASTTTCTSEDTSQKNAMKTSVLTDDGSKKLATTTSSSTQYDSQKAATTSPNVDTSAKITATTFSTSSQDVVLKPVTVADSSSTSQNPPQTILTKNIPASSQIIQQKSIVPGVPFYSQEATQKLTNPVMSPSSQDAPKKEDPISPSAQQSVTCPSDSVTQSPEISKPNTQEKELKVESTSTKAVPVFTKPETAEISKTDTGPTILPQDEPVASTSKACFPTFSTQVTAGNSNTWSDSTKRKRRAPPPPTGKAPPKFVNGVASNSNSIVTDIPNDVPSSSSQAAALVKFKRINESPVRSVGTFEIRPRKKERSVEPVTRPLSYIIGQNSNTLSSTHSLRNHHKRSSSESYNTNTRGRIHKPGKKKAPPPPNPFGDPDAEEDIEDNSVQTSVSATTTNVNANATGNTTSSASSSAFSSPQVVKKSSEKPPLPKVASTPQTQEPTAPTSSSTHTNIVTVSSTIAPVTSVVTTTASIQNAPSLTAPDPVTIAAVIAPVNNSVECSSDELEEIRQNMLNDQQERQLLANDSSSQSTTTTNEQHPDMQVNNSTPTSPEQSSSSNHALSRNDIQAAQNTLQVLTASISTTKPKESTTPEAAKAKLVELKKEADKSPLNATPKKKSRPASIGSSIYESPLALLLGKSSRDTAGTGGESSAENSPRSTPKPWYKRSASSAFAKQLVSPKSKSSNVKPFTALVKFSELDKEAAKIVEENRRKSAEQRFNENAQELLALFSSTFPEPAPATTTAHEPGESLATSTLTQSHTGSALPAPNKVSTIAQVHAISEETELANEENSTSAGSPTATNQNSSRSPSGGPAGSAPPTNSGSSSPPAFQSVHAASKHRQIKPLLTTSPSTAVRSDKLAIIQPQSSSSTENESNDKTPWRVTRTSAQTSSTPSAVITTSSTTVVSSQSTGNTSSTSVTSIISPSPLTTTTTTPAETKQRIIPTSSSTPILPSTTTITSAISTGTTTTTTTTNSATSATISTGTTATTTTAVTPSQAKTNTTEQWDCPRCTLKNPNWRILCEICFHRKEPITSNSYMSSILQRVNAESTSKVSTSPVTSPAISTTPAASTCISAARQRNSVTDTSSVITTVPPSSTSPPASTAIPPGQSLTSCTSTSPLQNKNTRQILETKQSDIPSCENFLSQLPIKEDVSKEEKLYGMRLHEDPELEELDIGKLREARLAYFQKQNSTTSTTSYHSAASSADESVESPTKTNDLGAYEHPHQPRTNPISRDNTFSQQASRKSASSSCEADEKDTQPQQKFEDNDDDFIDYILQLDNRESPTNVSNITGPDSSCLRPLKPTSSTSTSFPSSGVPPTATQPLSSSPNLFLRYRPRLEMIREGNSGDYTTCYSSTEIAQIYENWQANENRNGIGNKTSSSSSQALHPFPQQTHLFEYQQQPQTSTTVHQHPVVFGNNVYPTGAPFPANNSTQGNFVPILPVDHQPYANNRLSHSPEDNYVNTMAGMAPTATTTPTLNETANFSCATSPLRFSPFPPVLCNNNVNDTSSINMSRSSGDRQINQRFGESSNYENNGMSVTPGGSRRLTYEDYRRMGAIPKGYSFSSRNDDWSSESSCDTDTSSRGYWARAGYQDSLHGMTRRGNLDIPHDQSNGFPEPNAAHGKLMKRLEAAIANGDHRLAATLAHDLALMKVNCVVAKINQPFSIRVYVEDRFMQQGPFLMQVSSMMTVHELKVKIESDWGIPSGFQKWILGRKMAEDDNLSLSSYEMAQDSMAFLFLVTPDIGNVRPNVVVPIDNKASNNVPSISEASTSAVIKNINKSDRNSMSPTQRNIMPSYANLNDNSGHVYTNFSMDNINVVQQPAATKQSPRVVRKSQDSAASITSEPKINSSSAKSNNQPTNAVVVASPKKSSSVQTTTPIVASSVTPSKTEKVDNRGESMKKESSPPPLPSRSPIPHAQSIKSEKGNRTPIKAHSKTPERTTSNPGSLKSNQKNVKQQNSNPKAVANPTSQQPTSINAETLSAASQLTASLQQKLAEFKNLAELTFSKAGSPAPGPSRSIKEPSPAKIINKSDVEKKFDPKEAKPPRKPGKAQPVPSSSKEKRLTSANNSTEKLAKKGLKNEDPVKENRFNGVLLPTPKENENVKPPERSDKTKGSSVAHEATAKQRLPKADKVIYENKPKDIKTPEESTIVQLKPVEFKEKSPETVKQPSIHYNLVAVKVEESTTNAVESPDVISNPQSPTNHVQEEFFAPKPMPRGLKKQQSVERELQSPDKHISAPKPTPRTALNKGVSTGATCELKDPQDYNIPITSAALIPATSSITAETPQQQAVVEGGCQTTLPFPVAKHRFNATSSSVKAEPAYNEKGTSLLRPSAFVTQQARPENDHRSSNSPSTSSSSVLLSFITANSPSSTIIAPIQAATVNNLTVSSSSTTTTTPNIAHVQPFNTPKQVSTPTAHVAPYPSSSNSIPSSPEAPSQEKSKEDNVNSYLKMLELMEKQDLIFTSEDTECPVCFTPVPVGDGVILRDCLHVFCKECLVGCVQYADDSTVKCPYRDADYSCSNNLQEREIKALVPTEVFEKYLARSVKLAESKIVNTFHCKTPDCTGWCVFEDDVNVFVCPVCKKRNCLTCAAIHEGIDCLRFQRELAIAAETDEDAKQSRLMLEKMIQRGEALECPACHVVLLKKWGCDWVRCSYCKTEICWVTKGFRWGKGGKGDISGGCKCGVNGVKCHKKCTYCH